MTHFPRSRTACELVRGLFLIAAVTIAGCGTTRTSLDKNQKLPPDKGGVLVAADMPFDTKDPTAYGMALTTKVTWEMRFKQVDSGDGVSLVGHHTWSWMTGNSQSNAGSNGYAVFPLKPGEYEVEFYTCAWGNVSVHKLLSDRKLAFTVRPEALVFLGRFAFRRTDSKHAVFVFSGGQQEFERAMQDVATAFPSAVVNHAGSVASAPFALQSPEKNAK